jgi:hypothetical protein
MFKPFWVAAALLITIISVGVIFQPPYISPEQRRIEDRNQLLMFMLNEQTIIIKDAQQNSPDVYKTGLNILRTDDIDRLTIPHSVNGVAIHVLDEVPTEKFSPLYSKISISVRGTKGNVTITLYWDFGGGMVVDSGLTLFCSKTGNVWVIDHSRGWAP